MQMQSENQNRNNTLFSGWRLPVLAAVAALAIGGGAWTIFGGSEQKSSATLYTVKRMNMDISVLEGGDLVSPKSVEYLCQVEGQTRIISVVPEGTVITAEDVANKKVLVELDSAELREKASQQDVTVQGSNASYTQAKESFSIQKNQNESNITKGKLAVKFADMDMAKYLGAALAQRVLDGEVTLADLQGAERDTQELAAAFEQLEVGGEARQTWRKLQSAIDLAEEEVSRAEATFKWTSELGPKELGGKGYLSRDEYEADRLAVKRRETEREQAQLALDLFLRYEFPKAAEQCLSDCTEAKRELERIEAGARAELAKAEADLKSKEATFALQTERLNKLNEQIKNCIITATVPGMVVYPVPRRGTSETIEAGVTVRERQTLVTIPDSVNMAIEVRVHEASINMVKDDITPPQRARIVLDGFPDRELWGTVKKVARMPDMSRGWLSPDLKVYTTTVMLDNAPADLKPGMSAQVEIKVARLENVIAVPIQSVSTLNGQRVCFVGKDETAKPRPVKTGQFNNNFIEITEGLEPGEQILLQAPRAYAEAVKEEKEKEKETGTEAPAGQNGVAPAPNGTSNGAAAPEKLAENGDTSAAATTELPAEIKAMLERIPEDRRAAMQKRWDESTPEERKQWLEAIKSGGGMPRGGRGGGRGTDAPSAGENQ